jgi:hypothetical protein
VPVAGIDNGSVLILVVLVALPLAGIAFAFAGSALKTLGKGPFAIEQELPQRSGGRLVTPPVSPEIREAEVRQMVEAKSYRRVTRGEEPLDVDAEVARLLATPPTGALGQDAELREEVRQLVVARNERRMRRGEEPLDVQAEVHRQLLELENLGQ